MKSFTIKVSQYNQQEEFRLRCVSGTWFYDYSVPGPEGDEWRSCWPENFQTKEQLIQYLLNQRLQWLDCE